MGEAGGGVAQRKGEIMGSPTGCLSAHQRTHRSNTCSACFFKRHLKLLRDTTSALKSTDRTQALDHNVLTLSSVITQSDSFQWETG